MAHNFSALIFFILLKGIVCDCGSNGGHCTRMLHRSTISDEKDCDLMNISEIIDVSKITLFGYAVVLNLNSARIDLSSI